MGNEWRTRKGKERTVGKDRNAYGKINVGSIVERKEDKW